MPVVERFCLNLPMSLFNFCVQKNVDGRIVDLLGLHGLGRRGSHQEQCPVASAVRLHSDDKHHAFAEDALARAGVPALSIDPSGSRKAHYFRDDTVVEATDMVSRGLTRRWLKYSKPLISQLLRKIEETTYILN